MDEEIRKKYTQLAYKISNKEVTESFIVNIIGDEGIKGALDNGIIQIVETNDIGMNIYKLTEYGKNLY